MKHYLTLNDLPNLETAVAEAIALKKDPFQFEKIGKNKTCRRLKI